MSVRRRLSSVVAGKLDALLSRLEDPGESLEHAYQVLLERLVEARRAVEDVRSARAGLEEAAAWLDGAAGRLGDRAAHAVAAGDDDSAEEALARVSVARSGAVALRAEAAALGEEGARFDLAVERLGDSATAIGARRQALKLLAGSERSQVEDAVATLRADAESARLAARRAERAAAQRRAQAARVEGLLASGALEDLSATPEQLEAELAKARGAPELGPEMAALRRRFAPRGTRRPDR